MLRVKNHSVFDVFTKYFLGGAQRAPKIDFGRVLGALWEPLGTSFEHVGGSVALLGPHLGPKWSQKRQDEGLLGSSRGGQRVSEALRVRFWDDFHHFVCAIWYFRLFFGEKGFVHAVWYLDLGTLAVFWLCVCSLVP